MKKSYSPPVVDFGKVRKSMTIPDQSLSIQEIVRRYVRGIPVDVIQRKSVYVDQSDYDLEKLSRMDFGEKAEFAQQLAEQAARLQSELVEAERSFREAKASKAKEAADKAAQANEAAVADAVKRHQGQRQL